MCGAQSKQFCILHRPVKMSEAIYDMHAYTKLTDHVMHQILMSSAPELEEVSSVCMVHECNMYMTYITQFSQSRELLQKVEKRELYKCIGQTQPSPSSRITKVRLYMYLK